MVFVVDLLGLGLGVTPLIIEFLKANPAPLHAVKALRKEGTEDMMKDFYINLGYELSMFRITLNTLVQDLPIDDDTKAKLIGEGTLDATVWQQPSHELQESLERRLSPCRETFAQCMEKILCLLAKLVKDKTLPVAVPEGQIRVCAGKSYEKLEEVFISQMPLSQRLKFAWRKDKRDKLLAGISKYNRKIQKMLERTSATTPSYSSNKQKSSAGCVPHLGLRKRMAELCQAIRKVWCDCTGEHELRFGLSRDEIDEAHITLVMLMNLSKEDRKFKWGESRMKIHLQREHESPTVDTSMSRITSSPQPRRLSNWTESTMVDSPQNSPLRESPIASSSFSKSLSATVTNLDHDGPQQREDHSSHYPDSIPVDIMCHTVANGQRRRRASEIVFYDKKLLHRQLETTSVVRHTHPGVELAEYLRSRQWTMQDRKMLQVLLAHSILFFPWQGSDLNKNAIAFHHGPLDRPFASLRPGHGLDGNGTPSCRDRAEEHYQPYPNETLAALATLLLEIELQKPIEDMIIDEDAADSDMETRFWATARVLKEQRCNMYDSCWESIDACLRCDFTEGEATLDDNAFLEQVYERVIVPLEHELWNGFHIRVPGLDASGDARAVPVTRIAAEMEVRSVEMIEAVQAVRRHAPRKSVRIIDDHLSDAVSGTMPQKAVRLAMQVTIPRTASDSGSASS